MKKLLAFCLGSLLLPLAACGGTSSASSAGGDTLRVGVSYADTTLDPDLLPIQQMWVYLDPLYDSLTRLDSDKNVQPQLATKWTSGKQGKDEYLDMDLRHGLTFPDGAAFDADAVVANVERAVNLEGSTNAAWFAGVTVKKVSQYKVRFTSTTGVGALPAILAGPAGMMISPKAIESKEDLTKAADGIGPFTLVSADPSRIVYKANKSYWNQDAVGVKNLEMVTSSDDAMLTSMLSGDVQIATLPDRMVQTAEKAGLKGETESGNLNLLFAINSTIKPFDDIRVREALSLALDRESFCKNVWGGQCTATGQFFGPRTPDYDQSVGSATYDLDKAKQLIQQAGATGTKFEWVIPAGIESQLEMATYAQAQWKKIGLDVKITSLTPQQVVARFTVEKNAAITNGGSGLAFDPSIEVSRYMLASGLYNIGKIANPQLEKLAQQGLEETDADARNAIYKQISTLGVKNYLLVPVGSPNNSFVVSPKVKGWTQPWGVNFNSIRGVSLSN